MQYLVRDHIPFSKLPLITPASDWPVFFASAMYVFEGIALVRIDSRVIADRLNKDYLGFTYPTKNERSRFV